MRQHRHIQAEMARKNLEKKLAVLRDVELSRPAYGWLRAIRDALGMSSRQLAQRVGLSQSRISTLEKAEVSGNTTLKSLREAAEALDCTFVYTLVPNKPLGQIVQDRAREKAITQLREISHTMLLENQALTKEQLQEELDRMTAEILSEPIGQLWNDA